MKKSSRAIIGVSCFGERLLLHRQGMMVYQFDEADRLGRFYRF
jgi:hypothetical protein